MRSPLTTPVSSVSLSMGSANLSPSAAWMQPWEKQWFARWWLKKLVATVMLMVTLFCLTGCGQQGPELKLIKQAIALEFGQTQIELSKQLHTQVPKFKIENVAIGDRTPLRIEGMAAYRIQGQYNAKVSFPDQRYQQESNDFDIYLQQQGDTNNWRLAIPQDDTGTASQVWQTYLILDPLG